jgi:hypothetical protein
LSRKNTTFKVKFHATTKAASISFVLLPILVAKIARHLQPRQSGSSIMPFPRQQENANLKPLNWQIAQMRASEWLRHPDLPSWSEPSGEDVRAKRANGHEASVL